MGCTGCQRRREAAKAAATRITEALRRRRQMALRARREALDAVRAKRALRR